MSEHVPHETREVPGMKAEHDHPAVLEGQKVPDLDAIAAQHMTWPIVKAGSACGDINQRYGIETIPAVFVISLVVNVGMWLERFVIVVTSLTRDYVPSSWGMYYPTFWDWATYAGTLGLFVSLMFLFIRGLPAISIFEMREVVHHMEHEHGNGD